MCKEIRTQRSASINHIMRTCLIYHAACKVEFQLFTRSYSQLTFFNFLIKTSFFERFRANHNLDICFVSFWSQGGRFTFSVKPAPGHTTASDSTPHSTRGKTMWRTACHTQGGPRDSLRQRRRNDWRCICDLFGTCNQLLGVRCWCWCWCLTDIRRI